MTHLKGLLIAFVVSFACIVAPVNATPDASTDSEITAQTVASGSVNINTATAELLALELKGVGSKRAQAIVDYRREHGPFQSAEQLQEIKGIGAAIVEQNVDKISL